MSRTGAAQARSAASSDGAAAHGESAHRSGGPTYRLRGRPGRRCKPGSAVVRWPTRARARPAGTAPRRRTGRRLRRRRPVGHGVDLGCRRSDRPPAARRWSGPGRHRVGGAAVRLRRRSPPVPLGRPGVKLLRAGPATGRPAGGLGGDPPGSAPRRLGGSAPRRRRRAPTDRLDALSAAAVARRPAPTRHVDGRLASGAGVRRRRVARRGLGGRLGDVAATASAASALGRDASAARRPPRPPRPPPCPRRGPSRRGLRPPPEPLLRPLEPLPPPPCSTGSVDTSTPRPLQCSQVVQNASSRPVPTRLRVICTRPSEVTSATWWRVRSRPRHSVSRRSTRSRLDSSTMSMKSMTMMPPMSRSRSWRTISSADSRLLRVTVSSRLPPEPVNLPVLTSMTVIASVRSMTR